MYAMVLESLNQVVQRFERQPQWRQRQQFRLVQMHWPQVVGTTVARQAQPSHIRQQVLHVTVANPMWSQTLTLERRHILAKLNPHLPTPLQDLRFSSGKWHQRTAPPPVPNILKQHPSYNPTPPDSAPFNPPTRPTPTAQDNFQRWAEAHQYQARRWPLCGVCGAPCPPGELQRWGRCGLCQAAALQRTHRLSQGTPPGLTDARAEPGDDQVKRPSRAAVSPSEPPRPRSKPEPPQLRQP